MIYYPIMKLREVGVTSILIVSGKGHAGHFLELLGSGSEFGVNLSYEVQEEAGGIAQAIGLAENFVGEDPFVVILGDNIYEDDLSPAVQSFLMNDSEAHIFLKKVESPENYGCPRFENEQIVEIIEKPKIPPSSYAVTGCYLYRSDVFEFVRKLKPSNRGELEVSDINDHYVKKGTLSSTSLKAFWGDCGESIDGMMEVSKYIQEHGISAPHSVSSPKHA